jgi:hypothetical protein
MNERFYPVNQFDNPENPFNTQKFIEPLLNTKEGQDFIREHKKYLTGERNIIAGQKSPFPQFLLAQLWTAMEQWCLAYAKAQTGWPSEKKHNQ